MDNTLLNTAICIVGSTGTGKSAVATKLAREINGVIINADSRQVYADFPIITSQPDLSNKMLAPHFLYGFLPTENLCTAGFWIDKVKLILQETNQIPIFVGGTGMYIKSLFDGIANIPKITRETIRNIEDRFDKEKDSLHNELKAIDPEYAIKIHPHDKQRVTRALAVFYSTKKTFSEWHKSTIPQVRFNVKRYAFAVSLIELEPYLKQRINNMLDAGAIYEAQLAFEKCSDPKAPGWSGIGCAELHQYLQKKISLDHAKELWFKNTRAYAKRQLTWFRADKRIIWFQANQKNEMFDQIIKDING